MEKNTTYFGIKEVQYKFNRYDILLALIAKHNIDLTPDYEFFILDDGDYDSESNFEVRLILRNKKAEE